MQRRRRPDIGFFALGAGEALTITRYSWSEESSFSFQSIALDVARVR